MHVQDVRRKREGTETYWCRTLQHPQNAHSYVWIYLCVHTQSILVQSQHSEHYPGLLDLGPHQNMLYNMCKIYEVKLIIMCSMHTLLWVLHKYTEFVMCSNCVNKPPFYSTSHIKPGITAFHPCGQLWVRTNKEKLKLLRIYTGQALLSPRTFIAWGDKTGGIHILCICMHVVTAHEWMWQLRNCWRP